MIGIAVVMAACSGTPRSPTPSPGASAPATAVAIGDAGPADAGLPGRPIPRSWRYVPSPTGQGDACGSSADCDWLDRCAPDRCVAVTNVAHGTCETPPEPPGECACALGRCALRPRTPPEPPVEECRIYGCGLDEGAGRCVLDAGLPANRTVMRTAGPVCRCVEGRCAFEWIDPIPCRTDRDCWIEREPSPHPVPRPRRLRGRSFRPCRDGEVAPVCQEGTCGLVAYPC